ncbi:1-phosphofructokinase family hexose kinase [Kitasatospora cheerisanensis]|uniref:Putative sugar kinase n=1 Tax=Kitasatospora cheerisanensis KCTC 2395 TaxID=1348663 RepID=A0A066YV11_9ACTN|nr:1-phosphofructokinase family hexose kinase [Kitasatospora cheerisanensis]KDN81936.1 putative sugar kinase [Kitasatospora cheerisanensis KCTC 2395]
MILTVTPNPALDVTYTVPCFRPHTSHRVTGVATQAGGKGVNVARVLTALGRPARCVLPLGGPTGDAVRTELTAAGLDHAPVPIAGDTRRTVAVIDPTDATMLNEPGPVLDPAEWDALVAETRRHLPQAAVLVLSGSLPPGAPVDGYAQLVTLGRTFDIPVVLDADGPALLAALPARPTVIKPNASELTTATGLPDPHDAARTLLRRGAEAVLASLGADGLLAVDTHGAWRCAPPAAVTGNPTGAGDSTVAALAAGLSGNAGWSAILPDAVALSAATVLHPRAGHFDDAAYRRLRHSLTASRVGAVSPFAW